MPVESVCAVFEVKPEWNTENICAAMKTVKAYGAYTERPRLSAILVAGTRTRIVRNQIIAGIVADNSVGKPHVEPRRPSAN